MKSILQSEKECLICGSTVGLERHHVFGGPNRQLSEKYGLTVYLCHNDHNEPPMGVHFNRIKDLALKEYAQKQFELRYGHKVFMKLFGKNYLKGE